MRYVARSSGDTTQHLQRSRLYANFLARAVRSLFFCLCAAGVDNHGPTFAPIFFRENKAQRFMVSVEEHVKAVIDNSFAARIRIIDSFSVEKNSDGLGKSLTPMFLLHLHALRRKPAEIGDTVNRTALKPAPSTKHRMLFAQRDYLSRKF